jgi:hypothetical protein
LLRIRPRGSRRSSAKLQGGEAQGSRQEGRGWGRQAGRQAAAAQAGRQETGVGLCRAALEVLHRNRNCSNQQSAVRTECRAAQPCSH